MLYGLPSFAALCALCLFYTSLPGGGSAAAPLLALSTAMVYFSLAGMAGVLVPAAWVFFALCAALGAYALARRGGAGLLRRMASPGFLLFAGLGLAALLYFGVRQPVFSEWDEYTFWGVAPKLLKQDGVLYTTADIGFYWPTTQFPALPVLGWFVQFFAPGFCAWAVYWGYALLLLACAAALLAPFGARRWRMALPLGMAGLLTPFFFTVPYAAVYLQKTWLTAYADLPAGMLFGGVLALYFSARQGPGRGVWQAAVPLCALVLVKENVLPLALVAAGVLAADGLVFTKNKKRAALAAAAWFAAPAAAYLAWQRHLAWAVPQHRIYGGNQTNEPFSAALGQALREVFGLAERSDNFYRVTRELADSFLGRVRVGGGYESGAYRVSMAGTGLFTLLFILLLFALAALLCANARRAGRIALAGGLLLGGFAAYHFMLLVVYAYHSHVRDEGIFGYDRYTSSFTCGMMMLGMLFLALAAQWGRARCGLWGRAAVLGLAVFMTARTAQLVRPGYSVLDWPANAYDVQRREAAEAARIAEYIEPGGRVFFVHQGDGGGAYLRWQYHLLPTVLEYSITGGGPMAPPAEEGGAGITLADIENYLAEYGCEYILIDRLDDVFTESYGALFARGLADCEEGPALYRRGADGLFRLVAQEGYP